MKKVVSLSLALLVLALLFVGCAGPSGNTNAPAGSTNTPGSGTSDNSIVGTWEGEEADETVTYTFKADGTFEETCTCGAEYATGTYTISGSSITLVTDGHKVLVDNAYFAVNGNTLTIGANTYTRK